MLIDVHAHFVPPLPPERLGDPRWPVLVAPASAADHWELFRNGTLYRRIDASYVSVERRLARLDTVGIDVQVISPLPVLIPSWADGVSAAQWCRALNRGIADAVVTSKGRLLGFGILPVQSSELAWEVWNEARQLGLVGVELGTALDAARLVDDPALDPLLESLAADDVPVLVHPNRPHVLGAVGPDLERGLAVPTDTALAFASRLLGDGGPEHMPRTCLSHGGGTLLWEWNRITAGASDRRVRPGWLWADTAGCTMPHLQFLEAVLGDDRVVFGSDHPATPDDRVAELIGGLDGAWLARNGRVAALEFLGARGRVALGR